MNPHRSRHTGKSALDLIEDATQLLRCAPAGVLLSYYVGSVPAMLGLLYFFSDMSRGAFARAHLMEASLAMGLLYLWMKCWHSVFASGLRATLALEPAPVWSMTRVARLVLVQTAIQPSGLFARLVAAQILVPYVWVYSFYQSVGVLGDGTSADVRDVIRRASAQAALWPRQAHYTLLLLFVFAIVVALNAIVAVFLAPGLLKMFFGIETVFSRSPMSMLNTTVFAAIAALTYLIFDPLRKALYVIRCFQGDALRSGDDLRVALKRARVSAGRVALAAACALLFLPLAPTRAAASPAPVTEVEARQLDRSIERVLERNEYAWRMPRDKAPETEKGWLATFVEELFKSIGRWTKKIFTWISDLFSKVRQWFGGNREAVSSGDLGDGLSGAARPMLYALSALVIAMLVVLIVRMRRTARVVIATAEPVAPRPDLTSEDVLADQLPEDGWLRLARELIDAGELRLALRASYLAGLAHLGRRDLITIARYKSNLDYDRELRRRARPQPDLVSAFEENMGAFEAAWYGLHDVTIETLRSFEQNLERIRAC